MLSLEKSVLPGLSLSASEQLQNKSFFFLIPHDFCFLTTVSRSLPQTGCNQYTL